MGKGSDSGKPVRVDGTLSRTPEDEVSSEKLLNQVGPPVNSQTDLLMRLFQGSFLQRLSGAALDWIYWLLTTSLRDNAENFFLSGNFAPVLEGPGVRRGLKIEGSIPDYVRGEFVRTGPNPKYRPAAGYHWFDGDGMLHGVRFRNGDAYYVNRFVRTNKLEQEDAAGKALFLKMGDLKGFRGLMLMLVHVTYCKLGLRDRSNGVGTANTALVFHGGNLLALHEGDKPYAVHVLEDGDLETLGRRDYGGVLDHNFTAHPKVDPMTGEMFAFAYDVETAPYCKYRVISALGDMGPRVGITLPDPIMMHDFAVTEKHAIFMDHPLVFDAQTMIKNKSLPFVWKGAEKPARFGLLPRNATNEANIRWFTRPPCMVFHTANAWEEGDETVLIACRLDQVHLQLEDTPDPSFLTEFRFNTVTGESSERRLGDMRCDFPRINDNFACRKQQFVYAAVFDGAVDIVGVVKFDLSKTPKLLDSPLPSYRATAQASVSLGGCAVGFFDHGPGRFGSEPVFVPRTKSLLPSAEDDGCLLNIVFDSAKFLSEVVIIDAKTMSPNPLAVIHLNARVPYGFHGLFVSEEEMQKQQV